MEGSTGNQWKIESKLFSLNFLWNTASKLQTYSYDNKHLGTILHQLREKCVLLSRNEVIDSLSVSKKSEVCSSCGNCYSDGKYKLKILPHKHKMKLLREKLLGEHKEVKSKYKKYLSSFFSKRKDNVLVKQCKVCKKVFKLGLNKPTLKNEEDKSILTLDESKFTENKKRKKKKSKKERFSGLDPAAVISARLSQSLGGSLPSPNHLKESTSTPIKSDSDKCCNLSNTSLIENISLKKHKLLDDNSNTSLEWNCGSVKSDKPVIREMELCNRDSKKRKKQKSSVMPNSFISFNDISVPNCETHLKKAEHISPQLNKSVKMLNQNQIGLKKSAIKQLNSQRSKINKRSKKKKKSDLADFLNQL